MNEPGFQRGGDHDAGVPSRRCLVLSANPTTLSAVLAAAFANRLTDDPSVPTRWSPSCPLLMRT